MSSTRPRSGTTSTPKKRTEDLNKFFDYYLKDINNNWTQTAAVRLALLNYTKPAIEDKSYTDLPWHLPEVVSKDLYLTPEKGLSTVKPPSSHTISYQADTAEEVDFIHEFISKTVIVGPSTLVIDMSAPDHDDLDVYTHIFKADRDGKVLSHKNIPTPDTLSAEEEFKTTNNRVFRYWGPSGILRASQRHVSAEKSGKSWNTLSYEHPQKIKPGEVVSLEIQLWPTGIVFEAGEKLILRISGEKLGVLSLPHLIKEPNPNQGKHVLHLGGQFASRLQFFTTDI